MPRYGSLLSFPYLKFIELFWMCTLMIFTMIFIISSNILSAVFFFSPFLDYHYAYTCVLEKIPLPRSCYFYCIPQISEALLILYFVCIFFFMWEVNISETNNWGISESKHLLKLSVFF